MMKGHSHERRRSRRFRLRDGVFAAIRPDFRRVGRILDAGPGGVALVYATDLEGLEGGRVSVDVFSEDRDTVIRGVPCRVVYDVDEPASPAWCDIRSRRCGLQFQDLADSQSRLLNDLFRSHRA